MHRRLQGGISQVSLMHPARKAALGVVAAGEGFWKWKAGLNRSRCVDPCANALLQTGRVARSDAEPVD
jgi:hypothetical protein